MTSNIASAVLTSPPTVLHPFGDPDTWDIGNIIGPSPPKDGDGGSGEDEKYSITLVGVRKNRYESRKNFLKGHGVKVPRGLSDLELAVIIHGGTNMQPDIRGSFTYFELHPLSTNFSPVDHSTVRFHENKGLHYATIEPAPLTTGAQHKPNSYSAQKPFLLPGTRRGLFLSSALSIEQLVTLAKDVNRTATTVNESTSKEDYTVTLEAYIQATQNLYNAASQLFTPNELKSYQNHSRKKLAAAHRNLPLFSFDDIETKQHIDTKYGNILKQLAAYAVGTTGARDRYLRADYRDGFSLLQACIASGSAVYAISQTPPYDHLRLFGGAGLFLCLGLDSVVRATTGGTGIIGQAYGGLRNTSRLLSRAIRTERA